MMYLRLKLKLLFVVWTVIMDTVKSHVICFMGQQPDPSRGPELRWVLPYNKEERCECTKILRGGMNIIAPVGAENHFYTDEPWLFFNNDDEQSLRKLLECETVHDECHQPEAHGMEDESISNGQITASSYFNGTVGEFSAWKGRLNKSGSWATETKNPYTPWFQIDFLNPVIITGIQTQGSGAPYQAWVTKLQIQTGDSENALAYIMNDNKNMTFNANEDRDSIVTIGFPSPIKTRYLRVRPTEWKLWCALRLEVLGCE